MKSLLILGLAAIGGSAQAVELYNNGPVVDANGLSILVSPNTTFGLGVQVSAGNSVADDFTVGGGGWNVQSLSLYSYQTNASAFTFTSATWSIVSGDVNAGTVVASGTMAPGDGGLQGYRVTESTLGNTARPIFELELDIPDVNLAAGSYWLRWSLVGDSLFSGPWQPLTADSAVGNLQQAVGGGAFAAWVDAGSGVGAAAPFAIHGSVVPEPGTYALMLAGLAGIAGWTRRRSQR